jgi:hypothetical protein
VSIGCSLTAFRSRKSKLFAAPESGAYTPIQTCEPSRDSIEIKLPPGNLHPRSILGHRSHLLRFSSSTVARLRRAPRSKGSCEPPRLAGSSTVWASVSKVRSPRACYQRASSAGHSIPYANIGKLSMCSPMMSLVASALRMDIDVGMYFEKRPNAHTPRDGKDRGVFTR